MQIDTRFGPQDVVERQVIHFVNGIPGFDDKHRFQLFRESADSDVMQLQSLDDSTLVFPVIAPEKLRVYYEVALEAADTEALDSGPDDHLVLLVILFKPDSAGALADDAMDPKIQANLNAPLVINVEKRRAVQKVLEETEQYLTIRAG